MIRIALGAAALLVASGVAAHGSVSMEEDSCKLRVGKYVMHFTGYQPDTPSGPKEFCEDIPEPANTIIVLDYVSDELRDFPTEVRIVRAAASGAQESDATTVLHLPARTYPNGSLALETKFDVGNYVGLVTVVAHEKLQARFPFSVGKRRYGWEIALGAVLLGALGLYFFGMRQRRRQQIAH